MVPVTKYRYRYQILKYYWAMIPRDIFFKMSVVFALINEEEEKKINFQAETVIVKMLKTWLLYFSRII